VRLRHTQAINKSNRDAVVPDPAAQRGEGVGLE
jgi:hypothetical protein